MSERKIERIEEEQPTLPDVKPNVLTVSPDGVHLKWLFDDEDIEIVLKPQVIRLLIEVPINKVVTIVENHFKCL